MEPNDEIIRQTWRMYRHLDATAVRYKRIVGFWRVCVLVCIILAAVLAAASASLISIPHSQLPRFVAYASALFFGAGTFFSQNLLAKNLEKSWTALRSAAEYLSRQLFLYRAMVGEYSDAHAHRNMADVLERELELIGNIRLAKVDEDELMRGCPIGKLDIESYIEQRVEDQIDWFGQRCHTNDKRLLQLETATWAIGLIGVVLGLINLQVWIAALSAAVLAIEVFAYNNRHRYLNLTYQTTVHKLRNLLSQFRADLVTETELVLGTEEVISYETTASMNEFMREGPKLSL